MLAETSTTTTPFARCGTNASARVAWRGTAARIANATRDDGRGERRVASNGCVAPPRERAEVAELDRVHVLARSLDPVGQRDDLGRLRIGSRPRDPTRLRSRVAAVVADGARDVVGGPPAIGHRPAGGFAQQAQRVREPTLPADAADTRVAAERRPRRVRISAAASREAIASATRTANVVRHGAPAVVTVLSAR